jgi:hypothetical protein
MDRKEPQVGDPQVGVDTRPLPIHRGAAAPQRPPVGPAPITPNTKPAPALPSVTPRR